MSIYLLIFKYKKCQLICSHDESIIEEFEYIRKMYGLTDDIEIRLIFNVQIYKTFDEYKKFVEDYCYMNFDNIDHILFLKRFSSNKNNLDDLINDVEIDRSKIPKTLELALSLE